LVSHYKSKMSKLGANFIPVEQIPQEEANKADQVLRVIDKLHAKNGVNPFLKASFDAVHIKGAPLPESDSIVAANRIAEGLGAVDERLRESDIPLPVVTVTHQTKMGESYINYNELQFDYGLSKPQEGLEVIESLDGAPYVKVPILDEPTPTGIVTPSWNSHYSKSTPNTRAIVVNSHGNKQRSREYLKPELGDFALPLPAGSLFANNKRHWPLIAWDDAHGTKHTLEAPKDLMGRPDVALFIGRPAIKKGLSIIYNRMVGLEQGSIIHFNELQPKYDSKVVRSIGHEILSDIQVMQRSS
jgi:hypothetical protein